MFTFRHVNNPKYENLNLPTVKREAVRAVCKKDSEVLMIQTRFGDYKFPGGGLEYGESQHEALQREVLEETGYTVERILDLAGYYLEKRPDCANEDQIFEMKSNYYNCLVSEKAGHQKLDVYEASQSFKPVWIKIEDAMCKNVEALRNQNYSNPWVQRETEVLSLLNKKSAKYTCVYLKQPRIVYQDIYLRPLQSGDEKHLLLCYSDSKSAPLFNTDRCNGDTFQYHSEADMSKAIAFWKESYKRQDFVRWVIESISSNEVVGTIEMFKWESSEALKNYGLLRIDLASAYETEAFISQILSLCHHYFYDLFDINAILTKGFLESPQRGKALEYHGYVPLEQVGLGFENYYVREKI